MRQTQRKAIIGGCLESFRIVKDGIVEGDIVQFGLVILFQDIFEIIPQLLLSSDIRSVGPLRLIAAELVYQSLFYYGF